MSQNQNIFITGMTCPNCERRIETALSGLEGITSVKASFQNGTAKITGNMGHINMQLIAEAIEPLGYSISQAVKPSASKRKDLIAIFAVTAVILAVILTVRSRLTFSLETIRPGAITPALLFIIGLTNSLHCVSMCGGINLSLCAKAKRTRSGKPARLLPSILYNGGRLISYTLIGGIVGSIGSVINISSGIRGVGTMIAGTFMLVMGLSMLNIPVFRKITPRIPQVFGDRLTKRLGSAAPFTVGLLNGLMPCGPLQTIQIYALGTGSFFAGALAMFLFSLGTFPLMFGLGAAGTLLSQQATRNVMKIGAVLVAVLGLFMLSTGIMNALR